MRKRGMIGLALGCAFVVLLFAVWYGSANKVTGNIIAETDEYVIVEDSGKYFIQFDPLVDWWYREPISVQPEVFFQNTAEMRKDLFAGGLEEYEIETMRYFSRDANDRVRICDVTQLWEPICPGNMEWDDVQWTGTEYSFWVTARSEEVEEYECYITVGDKEWFDKLLEKYNESPNRTRIVYPGEERNSTVYETYGGPRVHYIRYVIETAEKTLYVDEVFTRGKYYEFFLYGIDQGQYFRVSIDLPESYMEHSRPSLEWLSAFGLTLR